MSEELKIEMIYPEVFITGKLESDNKKMAYADALIGWANCHMGSKPPSKFGEGMMNIGVLLGHPVSPDTMMDYADKY